MYSSFFVVYPTPTHVSDRPLIAGFEYFAEPSRAEVYGGDEEEREGPHHQGHEDVELEVRNAEIAWSRCVQRGVRV